MQKTCGRLFYFCVLRKLELMCKFAVIYGIPEPAFNMAIPRLKRLAIMNPNVTFFPLIGPKQAVYFPMIIDKFIYGSTRRIPLLGQISHIINLSALSTSGGFKLSKVLNKKTLTIVKNKKLNEMDERINRLGLHPSHIDYTPIAYWNLDHSIMSWFNSLGRKFDFEYVIFYESDIFTTKPLDLMYRKYTKTYDACFADFQAATNNWYFYNFPIGSRKATIRWLNQRKASTKLFRSIFAGALISRRCLERLRELKIDFSGSPYCQNEMRLPTVLLALGFKCGRLDFPFVRYRPELSWDEIISNQDSGIFHPVKRLTPLEKKFNE